MTTHENDPPKLDFIPGIWHGGEIFEYPPEAYASRVLRTPRTLPVRRTHARHPNRITRCELRRLSKYVAFGAVVLAGLALSFAYARDLDAGLARYGETLESCEDSGPGSHVTWTDEFTYKCVTARP